MTTTPLLLTPGPVPVARGVRDAMTREMISTRGPEFEELYADCRRRLSGIMGSDGTLVFVNGSATAAMETAVCNAVGPSDAVVCLQNGTFGDRFASIARRHAGAVRTVTSGAGEPFDLDAVADAVDDDAALVTMVHAETSTGIVNPVRAVGELVRATDALFVVDCVTSVGCEPVRVDDWGVDMAVTAPQKAIGGPPGVSALTVNDRAVARVDSRFAPYYLDLEAHLAHARENVTPTTGSVPVYWALQEALRRIDEAGLPACIDHHHRLATAVRDAGTAMGVPPFPTLDDRSGYTNGVTVLELPPELDATDVVGGMSDRGVVVKSGIPPLDRDVLRIGSMGDVDDAAVRTAVHALGAVLDDAGLDVGERGADAVDAALG